MLLGQMYRTYSIYMNKVARRPTNKIYVPKKKETHGNKWKRVRKKYTSITYFLGLRSRHLYQFVAYAYTQIHISIKAAFLFFIYIYFRYKCFTSASKM